MKKKRPEVIEDREEKEEIFVTMKYVDLNQKIQVRADMIPCEKGNQLAFGSLIIDEIFRLDNVRLMQRADTNTVFLAFPARKDSDGKYQNLCFINDKECYDICLQHAMMSYGLKKSMNNMDLAANVRVTVYEKDQLLGLATIEFNYMTLQDVRIMQGDHGPFLAFPSRKMEDGTYQEIFHPASREIREQLTKKVLKEYQIQIQKEKMRREDLNVQEPPPVHHAGLKK